MSPGSSLASLDNVLTIRSGSLGAATGATDSITGVERVVKTTVGLGHLGTNAFDVPVSVSVERGLMGLYDSGSSYATTVDVANPRHTMVMLLGGYAGQYELDLHLNNASGLGGRGALWSRSLGSVLGTVDLGDDGSYLAGTGTLSLKGPVVGGDLHSLGAELALASSQIDYSGRTIVHAGKLHVSEQASLTSTSGIEIQGHGILQFGTGLALDRIADDIPISIDGGGLAFTPFASSNRTELLGPIQIPGGAASISVSNQGSSAAELTVDRLDRAPGAIVVFRGGGANDVLGDASPNQPRLWINDAIALNDDLIGGWAFAMAGENFVFDFATYDAISGVKALSRAGRPSQVEGGDASTNVLSLAGPISPLSSGTTINSLHLHSDNQQLRSVPLGGQRLTVETGGLLFEGFGSAEVVEGELTAGDATADNELLVMSVQRGSLNISADIVDNGSGFSTSFVKSGSGNVQLSGNNTYTGGTIVNGLQAEMNNIEGSYLASSRSVLTFARREAVPSGGQLVANGGTVIFNFEDESPLPFDEIHIRNEGSVRQGVGVDGLTIDADRYSLQSGSLFAQLAGTGTLTKTGAGWASLSQENPLFAGPVVLEAGWLWGDTGVGTVDVRGGTLVAERGDNENREITLNGGALAPSLESRFRGRVVVAKDAEWLAFETTRVDVSSLLVFEPKPAVLIFDGPVILNDDVTVTQIGSGQSRIEGDLLIGAGATFVLEETNLVDRRHPVTGVEFDDVREMQINGTLIPNAPDAALNLTGPGAYELAGMSVSLRNGRSLTVLRDGAATALELSGIGNALSGSGTLRNDVAIGDGAGLAPGDDIGLLVVDGNVELQNGSQFEVQLGGPVAGSEHDLFVALGTTSLGGDLRVLVTDAGNGLYIPSPGAMLTVLTAPGNLSGQFDRILATPLGGMLLHWNVSYLSNSVAIGIDAMSGLAGDYDYDGQLDGGDFLQWQQTYGSTNDLSADGNRDGVVNGLDLRFWREAFLNVGISASDAVPEPSSLGIGIIAIAACGVLRRNLRS
ncbi:MAG: hypothetical protein CMJ58_27550 [Planctomycetaceae bacterium]|nr:hypothetical protein [Planctomycetaceae bacterium]